VDAMMVLHISDDETLTLATLRKLYVKRCRMLRTTALTKIADLIFLHGGVIPDA
jgi:hypothetical protein